jgi:hypothetical protein
VRLGWLYVFFGSVHDLLPNFLAQASFIGAKLDAMGPTGAIAIAIKRGLINPAN